MKFFKKPAFAFLLVIVLVIAATLTSVRITFTKRCNEVINTFYEGVPNEYGERDTSIYSQLEIIENEANRILTVGLKYYTDMDDLDFAISSFGYLYVYHYDKVGYYYYSYEELLSEVRIAVQLITTLEEATEADLKAVMNSVAAIEKASELISQSGYNEYVRKFIRDELGFPTGELANLAGVHFPEYFK